MPHLPQFGVVAAVSTSAVQCPRLSLGGTAILTTVTPTLWLRGVVQERVQNHGGFRSGVHHSGHDIICHNRRHGPRELGWYRHLPTPYYGLNGRPIGPWGPQTSLPHREGLPLPATSPQEVESTLPDPAAKGTTESPDNPPPDASAAMEGTAANLPQPFDKYPLQWTPQGGTAVQRGNPPDPEGFEVVTTRSARRRARDLAAAVAHPVDPAIVGTVLIRPSAPVGTFSGSPRVILAQALSARPSVAAIRVNRKRNTVAADATTRECLEQLLTIKELKRIRVTAKEPADHRTSTGFLHGVDGEPVADSLLPMIQSAVPVLFAVREGRTMTLRFAGPVPPEHVSLFLVRFPVRPARPRPLQCWQCGRFGHVKDSCSWPGSCIRCGRTHPGESCKQTRPWDSSPLALLPPMAPPAATAVPETPPASAATLAAQPAAVVPGGWPAVPTAPVSHLLRQ
ncbi:hypothetical protein MRX96_039431 [Rhipicephalus microplus]